MPANLPPQYYDLEREFKKMQGWLEDNPSRIKTRLGMPRFIGRWLDSAAERLPPEENVTILRAADMLAPPSTDYDT